MKKSERGESEIEEGGVEESEMDIDQSKVERVNTLKTE